MDVVMATKLQTIGQMSPSRSLPQNLYRCGTDAGAPRQSGAADNPSRSGFGVSGYASRKFSEGDPTRGLVGVDRLRSVSSMVHTGGAPGARKKLMRLSVDQTSKRTSVMFDDSTPVPTQVESFAAPENDAVVSGVLHVRKLPDASGSGSRFPRIEEMPHFHYNSVDSSGHMTAELCLDMAPIDDLFVNSREMIVKITCKGSTWLIKRSYQDFVGFDRQLHRCLYDRGYSHLPMMREKLDEAELNQGMIEEASSYLSRLSELSGNHINCGPILNWLEMDNHGNHLVVMEADDSALNVPALAAARVVKRYEAQAADEMTLDVGELVSVIDMPPNSETVWWRGKKGYQVGFFPAHCVQILNLKGAGKEAVSKLANDIGPMAISKRRGKFISFLRSFFRYRPSKEELMQQGILRERVFGSDLGEHLAFTCREIPIVLEMCMSVIEERGIVDGIYRLSGTVTNLQRLRLAFDNEDKPPNLLQERYIDDIHCISSLLKTYFRELPNPLFTYELYDKFTAAVMTDVSERQTVLFHHAVQRLPPPHYRTMEALFRHLNLCASHSSETNMTAKNIAIVWAPNLLKSTGDDSMVLTQIRTQAIIVEFMIQNVHIFFDKNLASSAIAYYPEEPDELMDKVVVAPGETAPNEQGGVAIRTDTDPPLCGTPITQRLLTLDEARTRLRHSPVASPPPPTPPPQIVHTPPPRDVAGRRSSSTSIASSGTGHSAQQKLPVRAPPPKVSAAQISPAPVLLSLDEALARTRSRDQGSLSSQSRDPVERSKSLTTPRVEPALPSSSLSSDLEIMRSNTVPCPLPPSTSTDAPDDATKSLPSAPATATRTSIAPAQGLGEKPVRTRSWMQRVFSRSRSTKERPSGSAKAATGGMQRRLLVAEKRSLSSVDLTRPLSFPEEDEQSVDAHASSDHVTCAPAQYRTGSFTSYVGGRMRQNPPLSPLWSAPLIRKEMNFDQPSLFRESLEYSDEETPPTSPPTNDFKRAFPVLDTTSKPKLDGAKASGGKADEGKHEHGDKKLSPGAFNFDQPIVEMSTNAESPPKIVPTTLSLSIQSTESEHLQPLKPTPRQLPSTTSPSSTTVAASPSSTTVAASPSSTTAAAAPSSTTIAAASPQQTTTSKPTPQQLIAPPPQFADSPQSSPRLQHGGNYTKQPHGKTSHTLPRLSTSDDGSLATSPASALSKKWSSADSTSDGLIRNCHDRTPPQSCTLPARHRSASQRAAIATMPAKPSPLPGEFRTPPSSASTMNRSISFDQSLAGASATLPGRHLIIQRVAPAKKALCKTLSDESDYRPASPILPTRRGGSQRRGGEYRSLLSDIRAQIGRDRSTDSNATGSNASDSNVSDSNVSDSNTAWRVDVSPSIDSNVTGSNASGSNNAWRVDVSSSSEVVPRAENRPQPVHTVDVVIGNDTSPLHLKESSDVIQQVGAAVGVVSSSSLVHSNDIIATSASDTLSTPIVNAFNIPVEHIKSMIGYVVDTVEPADTDTDSKQGDQSTIVELQEKSRSSRGSRENIAIHVNVDEERSRRLSFIERVRRFSYAAPDDSPTITPTIAPTSDIPSSFIQASETIKSPSAEVHSTQIQTPIAATLDASIEANNMSPIGTTVSDLSTAASVAPHKQTSTMATVAPRQVTLIDRIPSPPCTKISTTPPTKMERFSWTSSEVNRQHTVVHDTAKVEVIPSAVSLPPSGRSASQKKASSDPINSIPAPFYVRSTSTPVIASSQKSSNIIATIISSNELAEPTHSNVAVVKGAPAVALRVHRRADSVGQRAQRFEAQRMSEPLFSILAVAGGGDKEVFEPLLSNSLDSTMETRVASRRDSLVANLRRNFTLDAPIGRDVSKPDVREASIDRLDAGDSQSRQPPKTFPKPPTPTDVVRRHSIDVTSSASVEPTKSFVFDKSIVDKSPFIAHASAGDLLERGASLKTRPLLSESPSATPTVVSLPSDVGPSTSRRLSEVSLNRFLQRGAKSVENRTAALVAARTREQQDDGVKGESPPQATNWLSVMRTSLADAPCVTSDPCNDVAAPTRKQLNNFPVANAPAVDSNGHVTSVDEDEERPPSLYDNLRASFYDNVQKVT